MADPKGKLIKAARQLVETDLLFGGSFMPRRQNPFGPSAPQADEITSLYQSAVGGEFDSLIGSSLTREQKAAILSAINVNEVRPCVKCILCKNRTQTVFGEGNVDAQLVFVGEGPGEEEDRTGRPFVGRAGELLNNMIAAMGLKAPAGVHLQHRQVSPAQQPRSDRRGGHRLPKLPGSPASDHRTEGDSHAW